MTEQATNPVRTTEKSLRILDALRDMGTARVTDLADRLDIPKSTVHNHLSTLREHQYLTKQGDHYSLSLKYLDLGTYVQVRERLFRVAAAEIEETSHEHMVGLFTRENAEAVVLYKTPVRTWDEVPHVGDRFHLHQVPAGLAMLAHVSPELREPLFSHTEPEHESSLNERLAEISDRGFASGTVGGSSISSLAVPVFDQEGTCLGAVSYLKRDDQREGWNLSQSESLTELTTRIERRMGDEWNPAESFTTLKHSWTQYADWNDPSDDPESTG